MSFVSSAQRRPVSSNEVSRGSIFVPVRKSSALPLPRPTTGSRLYNATPQPPAENIQNNWNESSEVFLPLSYSSVSDFEEPQNETKNSANGYVPSVNYKQVPLYPQQTSLVDVRYCDVSCYSDELANNAQSRLASQDVDG